METLSCLKILTFWRLTMIYLIIYDGLDLEEKVSILRTFFNREEAFNWIRQVAEENNVHPKRIGSDGDLYEVMTDYFNIQISEWGTVKNYPSAFGEWDSDSLWALVNHDFSRLTQDRWKKLKKKIHFPRVGETSESESSLSFEGEEGEKSSM